MFMAASAWEAAMQRRGGVCHPGPDPGFTDKQGQYRAFIDAYTRVHGRPPSEADLQRHFGVTPPSVHQMVLTLERAGLIRRQPGGRAASRCWSTPNACPASAHPNPA
jgi:predicted Rossmann fold nucleotide-binding protein DprA/Smf involved in DNA uptake